MDKQKVIQQLKEKYPGKNIAENPNEILCEVNPTQEHPEWSMAIAIIDQTQPHKHEVQTEIYEVIKGELKIIKNNQQEYILQAGDKLTINPGEIHQAIGNETWIKCHSRPGWFPEDHILS